MLCVPTPGSECSAGVRSVRCAGRQFASSASQGLESSAAHSAALVLSFQMRLPAEQFRATPVQVLSPVPDKQNSHESANNLSLLCVSDLSNCAGSAPNTPKTQKKDPLLTGQLFHEQLNSLPAIGISTLPPLSSPIMQGTNKYSTLPKKAGRRWKMISPRENAMDQLEGSLLTVCTACKDMVKQVTNHLKQ